MKPSCSFVAVRISINIDNKRTKNAIKLFRYLINERITLSITNVFANVSKILGKEITASKWDRYQTTHNLTDDILEQLFDDESDANMGR